MQKINPSLLAKITPINDLPDTAESYASYELRSHDGKVKLTLVGTRHTNEYESSQVAALRDTFSKWLTASGANRAACVERTCPDVGGDERSAVEKCGEAGLLTALLTGAGITPTVIEPDFSLDVVPRAREVLGNDLALASWAVLNFISATSPGGTLSEASSDNLGNVVQAVCSQFAVSGGYEDIRSYVLKEARIELPDANAPAGTPIDAKSIKKAQVPGDEPFATNKAATAFNLARDYGMLENILKSAEDHDEVFVWTGLNHALSVLPALEQAGYKKTPS